MDGLVMVALSKDKLEEAYHGCIEMAEVVPKLLRKINYEGMGEQDERECKEHLTIAASACMMLLGMMDVAQKEAHNEKQ